MAEWIIKFQDVLEGNKDAGLSAHSNVSLQKVLQGEIEQKIHDEEPAARESRAKTNMTKELEKLYEAYSRENQESKRQIGKYIHDRPARWIPRQNLVEEFEIDESGISRHVDSLYGDEFIQSKIRDDQRVVQWHGRGVGGFGYWARQVAPSQLWSAGSELRPLLTFASLGGAYIPTIFFGVLILIGFLTALFGALIANLPVDTLLGLSVLDAVVWSGIITIMASILVVLIPLARIAEIGVEKAWKQVSSNKEED